MSTSHVESSVTDLLIGQPGPAATALLLACVRWWGQSRLSEADRAAAIGP